MQNFIETDVISYYDNENDFDAYNAQILTNLVKATIVFGMLGLLIVNPAQAKELTKTLKSGLKD